MVELPIVGNAVSVRVDAGRVRTAVDLLAVVETVAVGVGPGRIRARTEAVDERRPRERARRVEQDGQHRQPARTLRADRRRGPVEASRIEKVVDGVDGRRLVGPQEDVRVKAKGKSRRRHIAFRQAASIPDQALSQFTRQFSRILLVCQHVFILPFKRTDCQSF